jgi:hypothetical protein
VDRSAVPAATRISLAPPKTIPPTFLRNTPFCYPPANPNREDAGNISSGSKGRRKTHTPPLHTPHQRTDATHTQHPHAHISHTTKNQPTARIRRSQLSFGKVKSFRRQCLVVFFAKSPSMNPSPGLATRDVNAPPASLARSMPLMPAHARCLD